MRNTLTIARRQFASYFNSPTAYIVLAVLLLVVGFFFWQSFFLFGRATIRDVYGVLGWCLFIAAPALTMGLIADEKKSGTIELLLTMPVRDGEVIVGKFLGAVGLYAVLLLLLLAYPFSVSTLGPIDWGQVASGFLGLFLMGSAMLAVGLAASAWTDNQLVALFIGAFVCFVFLLIGQVLPLMPIGMASVLEWFSFNYHLRPMTRGVIDSRDVVFFLGIIGFSLLIAFRALESRRWT